MRTLFVIASWLLFLPWLAPVQAQSVSTLREDWKDAARNRTVPVKIDYPKRINAVCPVIIVSHGLGGSREALGSYGQYWAEHGYIAVHLQHVGSDDGLWRGQTMAVAMNAAKKAASAEQFVARVGDVKFALDELERRNKQADWPLHGKLDLAHIAMAGHSFGAITTQAMCGQSFPGGVSYFDPRIKVGIAFSPSPPITGEPEQAFANVTVPMFHLTGTLDDAPQFVSRVKAADRRVPFDSTTSADEYLLILNKADHMALGGRAHNGALDKQWLDAIGRGTTAFLDKYLKGDKAQATYLDGGAFEKTATKLGTFELKLKK